MRSRIILILLVFVAASTFALPAVVHAGIPNFGPIIESSWNQCSLGWGAVILVINNVIEVALSVLIVFFAPFVVLYAGFLYVTSAYSPEGRKRARSILQNLIIGIVIAIAAWLIVDAFMAVLYHPQNSSGTVSMPSTWYSLITTGNISPCLNQSGVSSQSSSASQPTPTASLTTSPSPSASGQTVVTINSTGPSGALAQVSFSTNQSDTALQQEYTAASNYSAEINQACEANSIPNCQVVITALIAQESSGGNSSECNSSSSCGIMQLSSANGGAVCASTDTKCITNQINIGTQLLQSGYNSFGYSISNALAAYNSGDSTQAGQSASGKNSAMVDSVNCPGEYAWQCPTNPGGLTETQGYVANICRNMSFQGVTCN